MEELLKQNIGSIKVVIDRTTCIGTGNCIKLAPEVFELDDEKIVTFKKNIPEVEQAKVTEACSVCPVDALSVEK